MIYSTLSNKQSIISSKYKVLTLTINASSVIIGHITRADLGISTNDIILFASLDQYYDGGTYSSVSSDITIGYSIITENSNNIMAYKIYNSSQSSKTPSIVIRVLIC